MIAERFSSLWNPKTIAIVGASDRANSWTQEIYSNLTGLEFRGRIVPVNPRRSTIWGLEAYASLKDIPFHVDLAIIAIPAAGAVEAVSACGEAGIPSAMVVSSGFRDAGSAAGAELQQQLTDVATLGNVLLLGPNVEGFVNYRDQVAGYGAELPPTKRIGAISMFSQSGTAAWSFAQMAGDRGVGLRLIAGVGVEAILGIGHLLEWAASDPQTSVAACYLETIRDIGAISSGLDAMANAEKRVVVCCPRVSGEAACQSAIAHTGELLGDTMLRDASLRRLGAIVVHDPVTLFETALLLECAPHSVSGKVAAAMQSGGNCVLFANALDEAGIALSGFSAKTSNKLAGLLPAFTQPRNPLDVTGQAIFDHEIYCGAIDAFADDPDVGVIVIDVAPSRRNSDGSSGSSVAAILKHAGAVQRESRKPVISVLATPLSYPEQTVASITEYGVTILHGHGPSATAIAGLFDASAVRPREAVRTVEAPQISFATGVLDEMQAAEIFVSYGIERPREAGASTPEEAAALAEEFGSKVVVKLVCASIPHKAREGLVKLSLETPAEAREAAKQIQDRARELGVDENRLLVQAQSNPGTEFLIGMTVDPNFGPAMTVRPGGGDVSGASEFRLLPLHHGEAGELARHAAAQNSGRPSPSDLQALIEVVDRFSWLAVDLSDRLLEIEANPIIISDGRAVAVDALAVATDETGES
jgi:acyl-CoA synthetase (NDP forming)